MSDKAENLVLAVLGVVQRDWPMLTDHWKRMFNLDLQENVEAKVQFALAALAVGLGDDAPGDFRQDVHATVAKSVESTGPDLEKDLCRFEAVWANSRRVRLLAALPGRLPAKFVVPPLEHRHEAIGIAFADASQIECTIDLPNGKKAYNLYTIGILGTCVLTTVIEANKRYQ